MKEIILKQGVSIKTLEKELDSKRKRTNILENTLHQIQNECMIYRTKLESCAEELADNKRIVQLQVTQLQDLRRLNEQLVTENEVLKTIESPRKDVSMSDVNRARKKKRDEDEERRREDEIKRGKEVPTPTEQNSGLDGRINALLKNEKEQHKKDVVKDRESEISGGREERSSQGIGVGRDRKGNAFYGNEKRNHNSQIGMNNERNKGICKYYREGWCKKGNMCDFSHNSPMYDDRRKSECWQYNNNGYCRFGIHCKYSHDRSSVNMYEKSYGGHDYEHENRYNNSREISQKRRYVQKIPTGRSWQPNEVRKEASHDYLCKNYKYGIECPYEERGCKYWCYKDGSESNSKWVNKGNEVRKVNSQRKDENEEKEKKYVSFLEGQLEEMKERLRWLEGEKIRYPPMNNFGPAWTDVVRNGMFVNRGM